MKKIVIMPNACKDPGYLVTRETVGVLSSAGAEIYMQEDLRAGFPDIGIHWYGATFPDEAEAIAVVGGDGSILDAAVYALARDIPLIGINMGRLGYLTELEADEVGKLAGIFENEPRIRLCRSRWCVPAWKQCSRTVLSTMWSSGRGTEKECQNFCWKTGSATG